MVQTSFAHRLGWFNGVQIKPFCTYLFPSNDFVDFVEPVLERFSRGASIAQRIAPKEGFRIVGGQFIAHGVTVDTRGQTSCPPYQATQANQAFCLSCAFLTNN